MEEVGILPNPIPVLVLYGTALVEENGEVRFFDDVYGQECETETGAQIRMSLSPLAIE